MHELVHVNHVCILVQNLCAGGSRRHKPFIGWTVCGTEVWNPRVYHERIVGSAHFGCNEHQRGGIRGRQIRLGVVLHPIRLCWRAHQLHECVSHRRVTFFFSFNRARDFVSVITCSSPIVNEWQRSSSTGGSGIGRGIVNCP